MKGLLPTLFTAFLLVFALSITACTDSLTGPEYDVQFEQGTTIHTLDARHNLDPASSNNGGGSHEQHESHNRVGENE